MAIVVKVKSISYNVNNIAKMGIRQYWHHLLRHCLIAGDNWLVTALLMNRTVSDSPLRFAHKLSDFTSVRVVISNWWGGGSESYILNRSTKDPLRSFVLVSPTKIKSVLSLECVQGGLSVARCYVRGLGSLENLFKRKPIEIIINQLALWNNYLGMSNMTSDGVRVIADEIVRLRKTWGCALTYMVHDYYLACPRITLVNEQGTYCNAEFDCRHCAECLADRRRVAADLFGQNLSVSEWRLSFLHLLSEASEVRTFSGDTAKRIMRIFPSVSPTVVPHELSTAIRKAVVVNTDALTFGVFGNIGVDKGFAVVRDLDEHLTLSGNEASRIVVFGSIDCRTFRHTECAGGYRPADMPTLMEKYGVNVALFPSVWPETFSYVTQELMETGIPLICMNIGAQGERVSQYGKGVVLSILRPQAIVDAAMRLLGKC